MRLSNYARKDSTTGEIVNLMAVDAQRFMDLMMYFHMIWSSPLQIILAVFFLWQTMGPSVLAGVGVMILLIPVNAVMAFITRKLQVKQMRLKDKRIKIINEVLSGIKVIKLYAWERSFLESVSNVRQNELKVLRTISYVNAISAFTWTCAPFMVSLATFATFTLTGHDLTPSKAFVALSLFNILRFPLSMLPMLVSFMVETFVSVQRVTKFLMQDELDVDAVERKERPPFGENEEVITVSSGSFSWEKNDQLILQRVNLHVSNSTLVAIVGQVGSGKSSLLSALLGEMEKENGHVTMRGSVAYAGQQAWIQNATVKDNVLFGKPLDQQRYDRAIQSCALGPDLEILPGGDMTEIGEKVYYL
ncbi:multidrug resistance-associated protein 1-like [Corticium candelabrum]|uniref:multidrug resistance-associated protein 1-like n=1 Tax=Corticium candelabrum TaxID=121492 RepID=UPI002E26961D|nr:multidrug resistance-associated protein 1-like [Corticium candelabrum]